MDTMHSPEVRVRPALASDLEAINRVIEAAVMSWNMAERVKRLSLPVYRYGAYDLRHMDMLVAETSESAVVGVAALEPADAGDAPSQARAMLLHGIYVMPELHCRGVGRRLLAASKRAALNDGFEAILVRANPDARGFFAANGMRTLEVRDPERDYPYRFWTALRQPAARAGAASSSAA